MQVFGQAETVNGYIYDHESGEPLEMANVTVKGTTQGTSSDVNGFFSIEVSGEVTLQVSFIGYKTEEVTAVPGKKSIEIHK